MKKGSDTPNPPIQGTRGSGGRRDLFLVTDLDNTLIDSRERFSRSVGEAAGYSLASAPPVLKVKRLTKEQRNKFYEVFLSGRYMDLDVPVKGSVEVLTRLRSMGLGVVYLTGRHHSKGDSLKSETLRTLSRFYYPMPNGADVILQMKPSRMSSTHEYKKRVLTRLARVLSLAVGVDDEPDDLLAMAQVIPLTIGMALSSQIAREIQSKAKVPLAKDWFEVESIIKQQAII